MTTITIKFDDGESIVIEAHDKLNDIINAGGMFSIAAIHPAFGVDEAYKLTRIYSGNPAAALGFMIGMHDNLVKAKVHDQLPGIVKCIELLSQQLSDSTPVDINTSLH